MTGVPEIKPYKEVTYKVKQSKFDHVPKLPGARMGLIAPSNSGKTVLLQNLILNVYRGCFARVFIYSPSVHLDQAWAPVKE